MDKIWQEIHCTISGGGCGGYILVGLNKHLNHIATVVCPKCDHEHQRRIIDGHVTAKDRFNGDPKEEICPTMAAWSKKPRTNKMEEMAMGQTSGLGAKERDGAVVDGWDAFRQQQMRELWQEHYGGGQS